jgi:hypothetical protein
MSIGGALLALGSHGYSVRLHRFAVQILVAADNAPVAEYPLPERATEETIDIILESILVKACEELSLDDNHN